ncbi:MAG TPA: rod shape-determining protein MreD [Myxococcota bacterium]|nr:rod shape-determining protein MreD [Myxococcota bacterium]
MIAVLGLFVLGLIAMVAEGAATTFLPSALLPDLPLLLVIGMALNLGGARALLVSAALGYAADILSGAPLGQHALLHVLAFGAASAANRSLELRTALAQATLAGVLTLLNGLLLSLIGSFLGGTLVVDFRFALQLASQAVLSCVCAPLVCALVEAVASRTREEEAPRRSVPLPTGRRAI